MRTVIVYQFYFFRLSSGITIMKSGSIVLSKVILKSDWTKTKKKEVFSETHLQSLLLLVCFYWRGHFLEFGIRCHRGCPRTLMDQSRPYQPSPGLSSAYLWPLSVCLTASLLIHTWRLLHSPAVLPPQNSMTTTISGGGFTLKTRSHDHCVQPTRSDVLDGLECLFDLLRAAVVGPFSSYYKLWTSVTDARISIISFQWCKSFVFLVYYLWIKMSLFKVHYIFSEFYFWPFFFC